MRSRIEFLSKNLMLLLLILLSTFSIQAAKIKRIICVGNSITYGYLIKDRVHDSYPAQLQKLLGKNYEVLNYGSSGKTALRYPGASYMETTTYQEALNSKPDLVFIKLGTNDSRPFYRKSLATFYQDYKDLTQSFLQLPTKPKVVLLFPIVNFLNKKPEDKFNTDLSTYILPIIRRIALELKLDTVNLHLLLADHPEMFPDQLHPNELGDRLIAERLHRYLTHQKEPIVREENKVSLAGIFGSNMVLQKGMANPLWGMAAPGKKLDIEFAGKKLTVKVGDDGKWKAMLPAMEYGGPYTLKVSGSNEVVFENIMIGEVWVCSGQSNMGAPVAAANNAEKEIQDANYPQIRLFTMGSKIAQHPVADPATGSWQMCSPKTVAKFSAVGYFFGRALHQKLNVTIGLINSSVGGTVIETWMSENSIKDDPDFAAAYQKLIAIDQDKDREFKIAEITRLNGEYSLKDKGLVDGKAVYADPNLDVSSWVDRVTPQAWTPLFGGIGWCRKEFELSAAQAEKGVELHLSRIDDDDQTYVNGFLVGSTLNVGDRNYTVESKYLKVGKNVIACRILNRGGIGGMLGIAKEMFVKTYNSEIPLAGTWKFKLSEVSPYVLNFQKNDYPTLLYNGMINPIIPYGIKGVIWYQGEGNTDRTQQYKRLFPNLINDWRAHWKQGNFPFLFVSLANYQPAPIQPVQSSWAELREAQASALTLPNTGMALAIDLGDAKDLHPKNKQDVGMRLAMNALGIAYQQKLVYAGPKFKVMEIDKNQITLYFEQVGAGLWSADGEENIKGFAIAGADRKFYWAKAKITGSNKVVLQADEVQNPIAVRYAWADNPGPINLYNKEKLPAIPFRTDQWDPAVKH
jgi:sialate O-acetylesterase